MAESLERLVRGLGAPAAGVTTSIFADWPEVVGAQVAAHCRPLSLRDRVLVVTVTDPGWATQLRFLERRDPEPDRHRHRLRRGDPDRRSGASIGPGRGALTGPSPRRLRGPRDGRGCLTQLVDSLHRDSGS